MRVKEQTLAPAVGAGKGPLEVPEQFGLDHVGGNRRAIHRDERLAVAVRQRMNRARRDFLAGAGFAGQQDRRRQTGDARDRLTHAADRRRRPDQVVAQERAIRRGLQGVSQDIVLALQPDAIEASRDRIQDLVRAEGFQHEIDRARAQRLDRRVEIRIGRDQDRIGKKADRPLLGQPFNPVFPRHNVVEDDDVEPALVELARGFVGIGRLFHVLAARFERTHEKIAHPRLVIDDQDRGLRQCLELGAAARTAGFGDGFATRRTAYGCAGFRCVHGGNLWA